MFDWDKAINERFDKKENTFKILSEAIDEALSELSAVAPSFLSEDSPRSRTYTIKQVPLIPISELGWANNEDGAQGGTQRSLLEDWLRNIKGDGFQDKLDGVQKRMKEGFEEIPKGGSPTEYIQEVMSYLVFIKTLTMAITNFNASAAGFNFEAFLATLMGGSQIPASGAKTIADFTAAIGGETVPISLKLYTAGQLEVGGSFTDLVNDMVAPNPAWSSWAENAEYEGGAMKYIACTKDFEEGADPLSRSGVINFYEFDISRKNIFRLLAGASKAGRECITSSESFMKALTEWDNSGQPGSAPDLSDTIPAKGARPEPDELISLLTQSLDDTMIPQLVEFGLTAEQATGIRDGLVKVYRDHIDSGSDPLSAGRKTAQSKAITAVLDDATRKSVMHIRNIIYGNSFAEFKSNHLSKGLKRKEAIRDIAPLVYGREPKLLEWYESLSPRAKASALKNTMGYLMTNHWKIPDGKARSYGGGKPFAVLSIGAPRVQELLESVRSDIMDEVFSIFDNMATMSDKLNSFFANGLKEKTEAISGAEAGEEAAKTAKKVAGTE